MLFCAFNMFVKIYISWDDIFGRKRQLLMDNGVQQTSHTGWVNNGQEMTVPGGIEITPTTA